MPPMMREMMEKMMAGMKDVNPMACCQAMMTSVAKSAEMAAYASPEVRALFEEWARSAEEEVLAALQEREQIDLARLAAGLKLSPESTMYFITCLVNQGKVSISAGKTEGPASRKE